MIYFIEEQGSGLIKVGLSRDPMKRLDSLQTANPHDLLLLGTIPGGRDREDELHSDMAEHHHCAEWFRGGMDGILPAVHYLISHEIAYGNFGAHSCSLSDEVNRRQDDLRHLRGVRVTIRSRSGLWIVDGSRYGKDGSLEVQVSSLQEFVSPSPRVRDWFSGDDVFLVGSWPHREVKRLPRRHRPPRHPGYDCSFWHVANVAFTKRDREEYNDWRSRMTLAWYALADSLEVIDGGGISALSKERRRAKAYRLLKALESILSESPNWMTE